MVLESVLAPDQARVPGWAQALEPGQARVLVQALEQVTEQARVPGRAQALDPG